MRCSAIQFQNCVHCSHTEKARKIEACVVHAIFRSKHRFEADASTPHILNTPNFVLSTGALSAAEKAKAKTRRVSLGAMMPSSHSRAVA